GDSWVNLVYLMAARNFGQIMATAAKTTILEVSQLVALGDIDPENIITPGIFVQRVFSLENLTAAQRA
ncbi:CoA-transferase, partial [Klebsiella pneumoniae]|uniref:CoA-transferase n=1 Tax=Klebsiella pneumoniae TaxID=573 RepID=UPI002730DC4A